MKSILSIARRAAIALFAALTLTMMFGATQSAQAQIRPFVDCVERVDSSNYRAYYGYVSYYAGNITYPTDSPDNYFTPVLNPPGQPRTFLRGIHRRVVSIVVPNNMKETWVLEGNYAEATAGQTPLPCADGGSNTHTITYQGRLSDAGVAANGQYDLRFQLFNQAASGAAQSAALEFDSVSVTGGVFTVGLDFGLLPAFLEGGNLFLEIGVRPGAATGDTAYATLAPRQPLTAAPYAIRAQSAANADSLGGAAASQFVQTGDARLTDARTPTAGSASYIQNTTTQQAASNFNLSGTGEANVFNARTQYNIDGQKVLGIAGVESIFAGVGAGYSDSGGFANSFFGHRAGYNNTLGSVNSFVGVEAGLNNTVGRANSFFGVGAGAGNTTGNNLTIIGGGANVGENNLTYATAIGSGAVVRTSNTIALGRENGSDLIRIFRLGGAGTTQLCLSAINEISNCSSSLRYKTNIAPFSYGLSLINQLKPITFDWKEGGMKDFGLGAEDVAAINPLLVTYNAKGEVEGVKYDRIGVILINAVKEQQTQIERQQTINQTQQTQIEKQQRQINELKSIVCSLKSDSPICQEK